MFVNRLHNSSSSFNHDITAFPWTEYAWLLHQRLARPLKGDIAVGVGGIKAEQLVEITISSQSASSECVL